MKMKKIYSYMFAAVAMFAMVACSKENIENGPVHEIPADAVKMTYSASLSEDTKTIISGKTSLWSGTENIAVLGNYYYNFSATLETPSASAEFSCDAYSAGETEVLAIYPYAATYTYNLAQKTISKVVIPTEQKAPQGSYDRNAHCAVAYSVDGKTLEFKNAVSLFKFTVNMDGLTKVCIYVPETSKASVVGTGTISYNDGTPTFTAEKSVKYVDVLPSAGNTFVKGQTYYFAVAPGSYPDGFTFEINTSSAKHVYMKTTKAQTLEVNKVYDLGSIAEPAVTVVGEFNNWAVSKNAATLSGDYYVAKNVVVSKESEFMIVFSSIYKRGIAKMAPKGLWATLYRMHNDKNGNMKVSAGTYDFYIKKDGTAYCYVSAGSAMPATTKTAVYIMAQMGDYRMNPTGLYMWNYSNDSQKLFGDWDATWNNFAGTVYESNGSELRYWQIPDGYQSIKCGIIFKAQANGTQTKDGVTITPNKDTTYWLPWADKTGENFGTYTPGF